MFPVLPDTRPYPTDPVKNALLTQAAALSRATSGAQRKLAAEQLRAELSQMLAQGQPLSLAVAMSMAADAAQYAALADTLTDVLNARQETQAQWFALPVIAVVGAQAAACLPADAPVAQLGACLSRYPALRPLERAWWLPHLVRAEDFAAVKVADWYAAAQSHAAAQVLAERLPACPQAVPAQQSVQVLYALGYGDRSLQAALNQALGEAALPLMQVWQQHLTQAGLTLFANPLPPRAPLAALAEAGHMRLRMDLDVFAGNAIRAVRLQNREVGAVMAAQAGGRLLFGIGAAEGGGMSVFAWPLSPREDIALVQQHFADLMTDCQVNRLCVLPQALGEQDSLPNYTQACAAGAYVCGETALALN